MPYYHRSVLSQPLSGGESNSKSPFGFNCLSCWETNVVGLPVTWLQFAFNSARHKAHKEVPFVLMMGYILNSSLSNLCSLKDLFPDFPDPSSSRRFKIEVGVICKLITASGLLGIIIPVLLSCLKLVTGCLYLIILWVIVPRDFRPSWLIDIEVRIVFSLLILRLRSSWMALRVVCSVQMSLSSRNLVRHRIALLVKMYHCRMVAWIRVAPP